MLGLLIFLLFVILGMALSNRIFHDLPLYTRIWLGGLLGILCLMWGVVPFSMLLGFSVLSHVAALLFLVAVYMQVRRLFKQEGSLQYTKDDTANALYAVVIPISMLIILLLTTHVLQPGKNGSLDVGQSTYGDLALHLGIITSIAEQGTFPPDYSIFPGKLLSYPFLVNSLSSSLYLFGIPLRWAVLLPSYAMVILLTAGFFHLCYEILKNKAASALSAVLFFFNGGFGFIYFLDGIKKAPANFNRIFTEFYQTPTNYLDHNIRWVNVICDMIVPQRTTLAGWTFLFPALWLLYKAIMDGKKKYFLCAGITAGLLPMVHTHSFMGLGLVSISWCIVYFFQTVNKRKYIENWLYFAIPAAVLALPQLFFWTFPQSTEGGFLRIRFDWVNDSDPWLWFWVKNVGIAFILMFPALLAANKRLLTTYSGAITIFVLAELILFQPNPYDNNKLFYIWYMFTVMLVSAFLLEVYEKMKGMRTRYLLMALFLFLGTYSSLLTIRREYLSSYELFNADEVAAAEFIKQNTPKNAMFITADNHDNPVAALSGRNVFSGTPVYLNFHGIKYKERAKQVENMYKVPDSFKSLSTQYGIDYVYFSPQEKGKYGVEPVYFIENYPIIYKNKEVQIFAISERAKNNKK